MYTVHKVKRGETVAQIAMELHSTTLRIQKLNGVSAATEGERLLVEVLDGEPYVVKPFDSLKKISEKFGVSENDICKTNGITEVFVGEVIVINSLGGTYQ